MDRSTLHALPLVLVAMMLIPAGDTAGKVLTSGGVAPVFVAWSRFALGALLLAPFAIRAVDPRLFLDWRVWVRALFIVCGIVSILTALRTEPIANVFGAFFVGPVISWLLSVWLLREHFSVSRFGLICLGFYGVFLVVDPRIEVSAGIGFAVLAGLFYGLFLTMNRWIGGIARPRALLFSQLIIGAVVLAPLGLVNLPALDAEVAALTGVSAVASMLGNFLLILAYRRAEASRLAPLIYTQLIWATLLGLFVFNEVPEQRVLWGLALVVASGFATILIRRD